MHLNKFKSVKKDGYYFENMSSILPQICGLNLNQIGANEMELKGLLMTFLSCRMHGQTRKTG